MKVYNKLFLLVFIYYINTSRNILLAQSKVVNINGRNVEVCDIYNKDTLSSMCSNIELKIKIFIDNEHIKHTGILYNNFFWQCELCRTGSTLEFRLGNGVSPGPVLELDCEDINSNKLFNLTLNGRKNGIWLKCSKKSNTVKSARLYQNGEKLKEVIFWPNGLARQVTLYSNGKRRKTGFHRYDIKGNIIH